MRVKRKYSVGLKFGNRVDLFIDKDFRIITSINNLNENECMVEIQNYDVVKSHLEVLNRQQKLKGIYYTDEQVFGFDVQYKSLISDNKMLIITRPQYFFKVQRRQQLRVDWFTKVEYRAVDNLDNYHLTRSGLFFKGDELLKFEKHGFVLNLSGKGMEIRTLEPIQTPFLICRFKYRGEYYSYLAIKRRSLEVDEFGVKTYRTGLEFINLSNELVDRTMKIVFEKMREIQRKRIG